MSNTNIPNQKTPNNDALSVLSRVEAFYENCFKKLRTVVIIGLASVGIGMPIILTMIQNWSFNKAEKEFTAKMIANTKSAISEQRQFTRDITQTSEKKSTKQINNIKDEMSKQLQRSHSQIYADLEKIEGEIKSMKAELLQKTDKDLAEAMAENYRTIASTIYNITNDPYIQLISIAVYAKAAQEYAKCDKQDDLKFVLKFVESRIVTKFGKKHKKSKNMRVMSRELYSIIRQNIYDILSIIDEKGYRKEYYVSLLKSIEQKVQEGCDELDKEPKSKTFYFF